MVAQGYIGRNPADSSVVISRQSFTASGITTDFTFASGYTVGYFDLYINGVRLVEGTDYTASDSATFTVMNGGAQDGDVLEGVAYKAFNLGDTYTSKVGIQSAGIAIGNAETLNFVGTGNTFAVNGTTIDVSISSAGAGGTWTTYDSNTGITTTKKVKIDNNLEVTGVSTFNSAVDFSTTTTFNGNVDVKSHVEFDGTAGSSQLYMYDENGIYLGTNNDAKIIYNNSGNIVRFERSGTAGEIEIDASPVTLKHSDSTRLQTTDTGVTINGSLDVSGISTFQDHIKLIDNKELHLGYSQDMRIFHNGSQNGIVCTDSLVIDTGNRLFLDNDNGVNIRSGSGNESVATFNTDGSVDLYYDDAKKFETTADGIAVVGVVTASSGIVTYYGDGSNLTGIAVGLATEALVANNSVVTLDLTKQDHKITATGICTITVTGGTEADSHTVRLINSGIATVGFSTYFLFPSGSTPSLPEADGSISLLSFTVNRVGAGGTQLLTGASLNYS